MEVRRGRYRSILLVLGIVMAIFVYLGWRGNQLCVPEGILMDVEGDLMKKLRKFVEMEVDKGIVEALKCCPETGKSRHEEMEEEVKKFPEVLVVLIRPVVRNESSSSMRFGSFEFVRLGFFNGYSNRKVFGGWALLPNGCHLHVTRYVERIKGKRKEWYLEIYFDTNAVVRKLMRGSKGVGEKDG